jgi:hypothetical protein
MRAPILVGVTLIKIVFALCSMILLAGCQALSGPNMPATLQAENLGYVAQATHIAQTAEAERQRVAATASALGTQAAGIYAENQELLAALRQQEPVAPARAERAPENLRPTELAPGQRWFVKTGVGTAIRNSDGCIEQAQVSFPADVEQLYATVRAFNIEAGVEMSVAWSREGVEVLRESWTLPQSADEICIWFSVNRNDVNFEPGLWSANLFADGFQLENPMPFSIQPTG